jgi:hypothetical protein
MNDQDFWEVFETHLEALDCYNLVVEDSYVAALTAVISSSDYSDSPSSRKLTLLSA